MSDSLLWDYVETPVGRLLVAIGDAGVVSIRFESEDREPAEPLEPWVRDRRAAEELRRQLGEYFAGNRRVFELPLDPRGTEFQRLVWDELLRVPFGRTASYAEIARRIGRPSAVRAVGAANGRNPLPIVVPCHRVVGSDGSLTGFGGGLAVKRALLELEGVTGSRPSAGRPLFA